MNIRPYAAALSLAILAACSGGQTASPAPDARLVAAPQASAVATSTGGGLASAVPSPAASQPGPPATAPSATPTPVPTAASVTGIAVGAGFSDVSPHQLVRTSGDRLYVVVPTCPSPVQCDGNALVAYGANGPGVPSGFAALDVAHEPQVANSTAAIGSSAIAIDGNDVVWVAWTERAASGVLKVATFDTRSGAWSAPAVVEQSGYGGFSQGTEGVALALDASGAPHVAYTAEGADGVLHVDYVNRIGGAWSAPAQIDDESHPANENANHPTIAFAPDGSLLLAWLDGAGEYTPGTIRTRVRSSTGAFAASVAIAGQAQTTIDDGPSLLVTADGTRHLAFIDTNDDVRYWYGSDGIVWNGDRQPPLQETHDPSLGPDGRGGVYIYGHGTPAGYLQGVGQNLYRFRLASGTTAWSPFAPWVTGTDDCSISTRWSQFFMHDPATTDALYWESTAAPVELFLGVN